MNYRHVVAIITRIHTSAHSAAIRSLNYAVTLRNWLIGAYLVEYEQNGEDRAAYGENLLASIAADLSRQGQSGLSATNLKYCRQFALVYPGLYEGLMTLGQHPLVGLEAQIRQTVSDEFGLLVSKNSPADGLAAAWFPSLQARHAQQRRLPWQDGQYFSRLLSNLSWSHLTFLSRIDDPVKRAFYELESMKSHWSLRELQRQIDSMLYERVGLSRDKEAVLALADTGRLVDSPKTLVRDPYILEFLGLDERPIYTESTLEQALIDHLQQFLHELGRDFCFIARQFRIAVAGRHHYLDLLFFHRVLRCLVAIDLKLGEFRHEHAGQMNFYLNYLKQEVTHPDENPPVGIILCAERDAADVHYATAGMDQQLFVSRYLVALPSPERLKQWLHDEQAVLRDWHRDE